MSNSVEPTTGDRLKRFAQRRARAERCELCSAVIPTSHWHLVEPATRRLLCACEACALLFGYGETKKYRRVPRQTRLQSEIRISDFQWNALGIPIGLAFFFYSSPAERVIAIYPSPAGPMESQLEFEAWDELVAENPVLAKLEPDVEALLANRIRESRECFRAPIDECYRLVGLVRAHWRGISGGAAVWSKIDEYFAELRERARKGKGNTIRHD